MPGFRDWPGMVSKWWICRLRPFRHTKTPSIENLRRIESVDFYLSFRPFNLNANTCALSTTVSRERLQDVATAQEGRPGSRDVFSASVGILARARARAAATGQNTWIGEAAADR